MNEFTKKKSSHITSYQKEVLIKYVAEHPELNSTKFKENFTRKMFQNEWIHVTNILNSIPGAPPKEWRQWRKCWTDIKKNVKSKLANNKKEITATGGGTPALSDLNTLENKIVSIITPTTIVGDSRIEQPILEFSFESTLDNDGGELKISTEQEILNESIEQGEQWILNESLEEANNNEETIAAKDIEHDYPVKIQLKERRGNTQNNEKTPTRKITKSARLTKSIENAKEILQISKRRLEREMEYREKKLILLERDVSNREVFMQKHIDLCESIVKELREVKDQLL